MRCRRRIASERGERIEVCHEEWSNRLIVTELWVSEPLRGKGIGKCLMDKAKEVAVQQMIDFQEQYFMGELYL